MRGSGVRKETGETRAVGEAKRGEARRDLGWVVGGLEWRAGWDRMGWVEVAVGRVRLTSTREGAQGLWARLVGLQMDGGCLASLWCSLRFICYVGWHAYQWVVAL